MAGYRRSRAGVGVTGYAEIVAAKSRAHGFSGVEHGPLLESFYPHQRDLCSWGLRKGRAAIFADTGLGKTIIYLEWARHVSGLGRVLILTPLAVAEQAVREGAKFGIDCKYLREDDPSVRVVVTNYEMLEHFDPDDFIGVVLDESSILKSFTGRTRTALIEAFAETPYRLCCTATPAPNDFTELGNHSEFLGIKTRTEMLSEYFAHDGGSTQDWRIKGHAVEAFWRWVCSWGAVVKTPADLGHDPSAFVLPPLRMNEVVVPVEHADYHAQGLLFAPSVVSLGDQRQNRRATTRQRVDAVVALAEDSSAPFLVWGELNDECDAVEGAIEGAVQIRGADSPDVKRDRLLAFADGKIPVLVTKPSIAGFGLNFQVCHRMAFMGASHSFESVYQAIRRCWRFGQKHAVDVFIIRAENEDEIVRNYRRKEADAARFSSEMSSRVLELVRAEVAGATAREWNEYNPRIEMTIPAWLQEGGT